jgi:hypothetical protein
MKFGELKSKIEKCLTESYGKNSMKKDLFVFKELVLKNKNVSKLFYLYDELSSKKGLNEDVANELVNQAIVVYENTVNKISTETIQEIKMWVGHINSDNDYSNIDQIFSKSLLNLESKIKSKKIIVENLKKQEVLTNKQIINVPLKSMTNVANRTINSYLSNLTESEQKEVLNILNTPKEKLNKEYNSIKNVVLEKLENQKLTSDEETKQKIDEAVKKITTEEFNELNFFKLKSLSEGL